MPFAGDKCCLVESLAANALKRFSLWIQLYVQPTGTRRYWCIDTFPLTGSGNQFEAEIQVFTRALFHPPILIQFTSIKCTCWFTQERLQCGLGTRMLVSYVLPQVSMGHCVIREAGLNGLLPHPVEALLTILSNATEEKKSGQTWAFSCPWDHCFWWCDWHLKYLMAHLCHLHCSSSCNSIWKEEVEEREREAG